jgi:hypothetical protein
MLTSYSRGFSSVLLPGMQSAPPSDASPSDVDLLAIFDTTDRLVKPYREGTFATIIDAYTLHLAAPPEVNVLLSVRTMQTWDSQFLEFWLAMAYSSLRVGLFPLHWLHDSLFKGFLKMKESGIENHTKLWQDFSGMLTMWPTLFQ